MDVSALIDLASIGTDPRRLEVATLEPVDVTDSLVVGLAAIVSELIQNATQYSSHHERVLVTSSAEPDFYLIEVADRGLGVSDESLHHLNSVLEQASDSASGSASGLPLVAQLARRHRVEVRLEHGSPGITAKVLIPWAVIEGDSAGRDTGVSAPSPDRDRLVSVATAASQEMSFGHLAVRTEAERMETEAFLESVFAPLAALETTAQAEVAKTGHPDTESDATSAHVEKVEPARVSGLEKRVPGEAYGDETSDTSHTRPGEAAVEIKTALTDFDRGRQSATGASASEPGGAAGV